MSNHKEKKNLDVCIKRVKESLTGMFDDMAKDLELEINLKDGEVLYCEKCHTVALLVLQDLRIKSDCKRSENGNHDFVVVGDLREEVIYWCSECDKFWFPFKLDLKKLKKEPCDKSKSGVHKLIRLAYFLGYQKVKPVVPKGIIVSIKDGDRELSPVEFHLGVAESKV